MRHSLYLEVSQIEELYKAIKVQLKDSNLLKQAYLSVSDKPIPLNKLKISKIDTDMEFRAGLSSIDIKFTFPLFGMISYMAKTSALSVNRISRILDSVVNHTNNELGYLAIDDDGILSIQWEMQTPDINTSFSVFKFEREIGEIVPEPIIEILQSAFLCLQNGANLAALSLGEVSKRMSNFSLLMIGAKDQLLSALGLTKPSSALTREM